MLSTWTKNNFSFSTETELYINNENLLNKLINENEEYFNLEKTDIFKESKNKIAGLDEDLSWINYFAEKINPEIFKKLCFEKLEIA